MIESRKLLQRGIKVIGIPCTIQDDIGSTDVSLGVDSAVNNIVKSIDNIRGNSLSRHRTFLVEVEGRHCGSLALRAALTSGADYCLIPEQPSLDSDEMQALKSGVEGGGRGRTQVLTVVSIGWKPGIEQLEAFLQEREKERDTTVRTTILGYVQRGGAPTGFDRLLGTRMGALALKSALAGESGKLIALRGGELVPVPFDEALVHSPFPQTLYDVFTLTR
jgi:6-phosphofructokinase 1